MGVARSLEEGADHESHSGLCVRQARIPKAPTQAFSTTQLFSGSFLKTSPERDWLSSVATGCPAGPPFAAGVRGQETAALGLKGAPPGLGVGGGQRSRPDKGDEWEGPASSGAG